MILVYKKDPETEEWDWYHPKQISPHAGGQVGFSYPIEFSPTSELVAIAGLKDNHDSGAVWVYEKNKESNEWDLFNPIKLPVNYFKESGHFGQVISFSSNGRRLAISAPDSYDNNRGAIYVYEQNDENEWNWNTPQVLEHEPYRNIKINKNPAHETILWLQKAISKSIGFFPSW